MKLITAEEMRAPRKLNANEEELISDAISKINKKLRLRRDLRMQTALIGFDEDSDWWKKLPSVAKAGIENALRATGFRVTQQAFDAILIDWRTEGDDD